jgi:hypothetical protein
MNQKTKTAISLILAFSAAQGVLPALGYGLAEAKFNVESTKKDRRTNPSCYAHSMMMLAIEYFYAGMPGKADEVFRNSVPIARMSEGIDQGDLVAHMTMWAQLLAEGRDQTGVIKKEDYGRLERATMNAIALANRRMTYSDKRMQSLWAFEIFDKTQNRKQREKHQKIVLQVCDEVERNLNADSKDLNNAVAILLKLAEIEFPAGPIKEMPQYVVSIEPDSNASSKLTQSRFAVAEAYKLRAAKLADRLPASDYVRIDQRRQLVYWYTLFGQKEKAAEQTEILVRLIDSRDPKVLFPARQPCQGMCGLG